MLEYNYQRKSREENVINMRKSELKNGVVICLVCEHAAIFCSDERLTATPLLLSSSEEDVTRALQHFETSSGNFVTTTTLFFGRSLVRSQLVSVDI